MVGVTKASVEDTRKFQEQLGATYPILADGGANFDSYGVSMIPAAFLLASDGRIYAVSVRGLTTVVAAKPRFEVLAENHLGEEVRGSPAAAAGCLLIRTEKHLYCIEKAPIQ